MKNILVLIIFFSVQWQAQSQSDSSQNWLFTINTPVLGGLTNSGIPGTVGYMRISDGDNTNHLIQVGFSGYRKVLKSLYIGFNANFLRSWTGGDSEFTNTSLLIGPQARYYIPLENSSLFIGGYAAFGRQTVAFASNDESKVNLTAFGVGAGWAYPLSKSVDLELQLNYDDIKQQDADNDDNEDSFGVINFRIGLGIRL